MASLVDFQSLADHCSNPGPRPWLKPVVTTKLRLYDENSGDVYEGNLQFRKSPLRSEHFSGPVYVEDITPPYPWHSWRMDMSIVVGRDWAVGGFVWTNPYVTRHLEYDVGNVEAYDGTVAVQFLTGSADYYLEAFLAPGYEHMFMRKIDIFAGKHLAPGGA